MIDLCIDARMAFSSGIGTYIREIVPYFSAPPFKTVLLVDRLDQKWCKGFEQILFTAPIYSLEEQMAFPKKAPACDLFWSPHYNVPIRRVRAKKRVATIHDACHLALGRFHQRCYARVVMRKALHGSDGVITVSQFSKQELIRFLGRPTREIEVIAAGVNTDKFQRVVDAEAISRVRASYGLPDRFILFVGNLKPHKNVQGLIAAFQKSNLSKWGLVLVGKDKEFSGKGAIVTGEVPEEDLPVLYSMADLFVFPSFYEGFGVPPLEAMSCGCPTAVSSVASIPEVCGEASLYFQPDRIEEMAQVIEKGVRDDEARATLVLNGFERIKNFDWSQAAQKHRLLFERICRA